MSQSALFSDGAAVFSPCERYRYTLSRTWSQSRYCRTLAMICLNPSKATAVTSDPTVTRQVKRAQMLGFGRFVMLNLFAFRSTDPAGLLTVEDPIGPDNDDHIIEEAENADLVICAWGSASPLVPDRAKRVLSLLADVGVKPHYLRMSDKTNQPNHPLYLPYAEQPKLWEVSE